MAVCPSWVWTWSQYHSGPKRRTGRRGDPIRSCPKYVTMDVITYLQGLPEMKMTIILLEMSEMAFEFCWEKCFVTGQCFGWRKPLPVSIHEKKISHSLPAAIWKILLQTSGGRLQREMSLPWHTQDQTLDTFLTFLGDSTTLSLTLICSLLLLDKSIFLSTLHHLSLWVTAYLGI